MYDSIPVEGTESKDMAQNCRSKVTSGVKKHLLLVLTFLGIFCGFIIGFGIRPFHPSQTALLWLGMPGELFLRMLKLMILPLIVSSVISGTASMDPKANGRISLVAFIFIVTTNVLGCVLAVLLALILKPGVGVDRTEQHVVTQVFETQDIFADLLRNIVPDNIVETAFVQAQTKNEEEFRTTTRNSTNGPVNETVRILKKTASKTSGTNILGLISVCMVLGIATGLAKENGKPFLSFFQSLADISINVLRFIMWFTPIGICSLIVSSIADIENVEDIFNELGIFVAAVTIGIAIHQIILMPLILYVITRRNPFKFFMDIGKAWLLGFATTSTAVAIPEMLTACEEGQHVDKRVSRFVIPFCVTLNADGSALYIVSAAMFIGNLTGMDMRADDILIILILTSIIAMALPSVPSSSIVGLVMVLTPLGVPLEGISLLFAVEWYLDRIRTTSNVISHGHCAVVTYVICKDNIGTNNSRRSSINSETTDDVEQRPMHTDIYIKKRHGYENF